MSLYRDAAIIARNVHLGQGLRSQLYSGSLVRNKKDLPSISFLVNNTLQKLNELDELIATTGLTGKFTSDEDIWLSRILVTELILGRKSFHPECRLMKTVYGKKSQLKETASKMKLTKKQETSLPRYVRVETNSVTLADAHKYLETNGKYSLVSTCNVKELNLKNYFVDPHVPALLVFNAKAPVHELDWVASGKLILQDKSSCLVAHLLAPHPCATVLDMCAAPGFKTQHVAAITHGLGKIVAVDKDEKRFNTLGALKEKFSLENIICVNTDVLDLKKLEPFRKSVEYILLDPPCSGTGIAKNHDYTPNVKPGDKRYTTLHNLQAKMLRSALTDYPAARRVTYSTCSITEEENESVIEEVLSNPPGGFTLVDLTPFYPGLSRGRSSYKCGSKCIRLSPDVDNTNGFFIAMFERLDPPAHPTQIQISANLKRSADDISAKSNLPKKLRKVENEIDSTQTSKADQKEEDKASDEEESSVESDEEDDDSGDDVGTLVNQDSPLDGPVVKDNPKKTAGKLNVLSSAKPNNEKPANNKKTEKPESDDDSEEQNEEEEEDDDDTGKSENDEDNDAEDSEDNDASDDAKNASQASNIEENGQIDQTYGKPREFWSRGHKRFGDRGNRGGSDGWRGRGGGGRGRGGFRGGRGGDRRGGRDGGDRGGWRGRGGGRGGGDRGGWRGRGSPRGDFRGGRGFQGSRRGGQHSRANNE